MSLAHDVSPVPALAAPLPGAGLAASVDLGAEYPAEYPPPGAGTEDRRPPLATVLARLGADRLEVLHAPRGLGLPVRGTVIWDAAGTTRIHTDDVVLAVGVTGSAPLSEVLNAAATARASAVIVKRPEHQAWLRAEAELRTVTVLGLPPSLAWDHLHRALSATLATSGDIDPSLRGALDGDLFALADAAAAMLGGPVEIADTGMRPLAYSNTGDYLDDLRRTSILTRQPPAAFMAWLRAGGLVHRLRSAERPLRVEVPGSRPRLAVPIRAGRDVLGYLWLAEGATLLADSDTRVLMDVARVASRLLLRLRTAAVEQSLPSDLLRSALDGGGCADVLADCFPEHVRGPFQLLGFRIADDIDTAPGLRPLPLQNLVTLRAESRGHTLISTTIDGQVYALVGDLPDGSTALEGFARHVVQHASTQLRTPLVAAVGNRIGELSSVRDARLEVDRLLTLLTKDAPAVATAEKLRSLTVLAELRELARERPHLLRGPLDRLRELDRTRNTEYLTTLRAYFDAQLDLSGTAKQLCVHRNTVRYRIGRIQQLCQTDLANPIERLVLELQLNLLGEDWSSELGD